VTAATRFSSRVSSSVSNQCSVEVRAALRSHHFGDSRSAPPARWSYDDVNLPPPEERAGSVGLNIELGADEKPARADLHLNTAELNLFTVALFLICGGRIVMPLNMLLLDDPLQNMDELTSIALARGLTKVVRLWASRGRACCDRLIRKRRPS
jgi:hypothetical protein